MQKIRAILFDKDGTLYDYADIWGIVLHGKIHEVLDDLGVKKGREKIAEDFLRALGIDEKGNTYSDGILFEHNRIVKAFFRMLGITLRHRLNPFKIGLVFHDVISGDGLEEKNIADKIDFSDAKKVFNECVKRGYKIGILTNDSRKSSEHFIKVMGVGNIISYLGTKHSPLKGKPHPYAMNEFSEAVGIPNEEIAVVGDAKIDMVFAKNGRAGRRISVLTGSKDEEELRKCSDAVYPKLIDILDDKVLFP